jgi:3-dehydroquinate synthase
VEKRSGFAEVIKHSLIADKETWEKIRALPFQDQPWEMLLEHSVRVKLSVVTEDPYEKGLRKTLNAGHTIGHAVETYLLQTDQKILHGEAIAVGLVCEAFLAAERSMLAQEDFEAIRNYIFSVFGKVRWDAQEEEAMARLTSQDKKNKGNRILCVLLEGIGNAKWDCEINTEEVKRALAFYRSA